MPSDFDTERTDSRHHLLTSYWQKSTTNRSEMLRRIKRFLGFSSRGTYFPNNEVSPADGSLISNASRKSTKSEKKAKKDKKKSPLVEDHNQSAPAFFHISSPPAEIVIGGEESVACSASDRQTVITDSLPYRDPSDKVFLDSQPVQGPPSSSSTRSLAGSSSMKSRMELLTADGANAITRAGSSVESVYSTDYTQETDSQKTSDAKSRELPVDCEMPDGKTNDPPLTASPSPSSASEISSMCVNLPTMQQLQEEELTGEPEDIAAMKKFNAELDGLLKHSAPPFQVSSARLPPMLTKELPPPAPEEESLLNEEEFDRSDSKDNSVTRILNESHEATMRSPENKHLRSYGY
ncbi:unnamed protein product [Caenorhabditis sp. 36 PRJEB53466]|nr:unnamed protein product [Caenorhabditis sp. 36 PRJEB53466]